MANSNRKLIDLTGQTFGRLTVLSEGPRTDTTQGNPYPRRTWNCICECGNRANAVQGQLIGGKTRSCGCLQRETLAVRNKQNALHGMSHTPEHEAWGSMLYRCYNPNAQQFANYGGRGIAVCASWQESFLAFLADIGSRPSSQYSIERKDNNGGYWCGQCPQCIENHRPANCRWATQREQSRNRRTNRSITFQNETLTLDEWATRTGFSAALILWRIKAGWSIDHALTVKPLRRGPCPKLTTK